MPGFTFLLTNPSIYLSAEGDSERWSLSFNATIERPERDYHGYADSFTVICDGNRYDGFKLDGHVFIDLHPSPVRKDYEAEFKTKLGYIEVCVDTIDGEDPPRFAIYASLCSDTFFRLLQANPENRLIKLYVTTISTVDSMVRQGEGLVYGDDPNGKDYEWHVEKKRTARLQYLSLTITARSEDASVSEPLPTIDLQKHPMPKPVPVSASDHTGIISRVFWAIARRIFH